MSDLIICKIQLRLREMVCYTPGHKATGNGAQEKRGKGEKQVASQRKRFCILQNPGLNFLRPEATSGGILIPHGIESLSVDCVLLIMFK